MGTGLTKLSPSTNLPRLRRLGVMSTLRPPRGGVEGRIAHCAPSSEARRFRSVGGAAGSLPKNEIADSAQLVRRAMLLPRGGGACATHGSASGAALSSPAPNGAAWVTGSFLPSASSHKLPPCGDALAGDEAGGVACAALPAAAAPAAANPAAAAARAPNVPNAPALAGPSVAAPRPGTSFEAAMRSQGSTLANALALLLSLLPPSAAAPSCCSGLRTPRGAAATGLRLGAAAPAPPAAAAPAPAVARSIVPPAALPPAPATSADPFACEPELRAGQGSRGGKEQHTYFQVVRSSLNVPI